MAEIIPETFQIFPEIFQIIPEIIFPFPVTVSRSRGEVSILCVMAILPLMSQSSIPMLTKLNKVTATAARQQKGRKCFPHSKISCNFARC